MTSTPPQSTPTSTRNYTLAWLVDVLLQQLVITARQAEELLQRERILREKILRTKVQGRDAQRGGSYDVTPAEVVEAAALQARDGRALNEDRIAECIARATGLRYVKIDPLRLNERLVTETMSRPFARRHVCVPLARGEDGKVVMAVDQPFDLELKEALRGLLPAGWELVVSARSDILRVITDVYGFRSAVSAAERQIQAGTDLGNLEQLMRLRQSEDIEANDRYVVNAVDYLLNYAYDQRASDIHIEPKREEASIRLRIDGVLHTLYTMPRVVHNAVVSRIKTLARMDIAERRKPQDGRIKTDRNGIETELRVSCLPVAFGEKVVIRIFDPGTLLQNVEDLGLFDTEMDRYRSFVSHSTGMILVTGPTGSGKTTTLYSTLKALASPEVNITTLEDPIEMVWEPFNQVLVQPKIGLTFANVLRTVLRQDPDIIMIGEIRDEETAHMAVQAALTGHLVLSTLHTNDAPSSVTRLQDLGVPDFLLASTLVGVIAQRLVRLICPHCRVPSTLSEEQALLLGIDPDVAGEPLPVFHGEGCAHCRGTGLRGRSGIFEIMPVDRSVRKLIREHADAGALRRDARANGMTTLRESAIRKLALGLTSFEEIIRVLGDQEFDG